MPRFASPAKQANSIINALRKDRTIPSIRSGENYKERLTVIGTKSAEWGFPMLRDMSALDCKNYLERRSEEVSQATLNTERLALQYTLELMGTLDKSKNERLPVIKSERDEIKTSRAYTSEQLNLVKSRMSEKYQLVLDIKYATGLRTADFYTLRPISEQAPSANRPANEEKFLGRSDGVSYTTDSKGGLIREVRIPAELAERLEKLRLDTPVEVVDRGVVYEKHYDIKAGKLLSNAFYSASIRALGWSRGVHGLRHTYAQERMKELQINGGLSYYKALETVSQELGHFAPETSETYLR